MTLPKPEYRFENTFVNGTSEPCQVMNVSDFLVTPDVSRRGFVGAGMTLGAVVSALGIQSAAAAPAKAIHVHAHQDQISGLVALPGNDTLISSSWDKYIKVWKLPTGQFSGLLDDHAKVPSDSPVLALCQSPDGKHFASGDKAGKVIVWDSAKRSKLATLSPGNQPIMTLLFTLDGFQLACLRWDGAVIMESVSGNFKDKPVEHFPTPVPPNQIPGLLERNWKITEALGKTLSDRKTGATAFCISLQGGRFAYADSKKVIHIYDTALNRPLTERPRKQTVEMMVLNRSGRCLAAVHKNREIVVFDLDEETESPAMTGHVSAITSITLTDDGEIMAVGHSDGAIALWKVKTGTRYAYCFDPDASTRKGRSFKLADLTYTQPCGTPLPANATCTCDCVPGNSTVIVRSATVQKVTVPKPIPRLFPLPFFFPTGGGCSCVPHCICNVVFR